MPPSIFRILAWFLDTCSSCTININNRRIDFRSSFFFFFFFFPRDMTDPTIRKNTKTTKTCPKNKKQKGLSIGPTLKSLWTCGSKTIYNFRIETRKIERGIAVLPRVLITTCLLYRNRFFGHISSCITNWAVQQISIVSICLEDRLQQFSPWSGNTSTIFGAVIQTCRPKMSPKIGNFEFSWISRRVRVGFSKLFGPAYALLSHGPCFQFSSLYVQWLTSFDARKQYPLLG